MVEPHVVQDSNYVLRSDKIVTWIESQWQSSPHWKHDKKSQLLNLWVAAEVTNDHVLTAFSRELVLPDNFQFVSYEMTPCSLHGKSYDHHWKGYLTNFFGAGLFTFKNSETTVQAMVVSSHYTDRVQDNVFIVGVPDSFYQTWAAFENECIRVARSLNPDNQVIIIGGRANAFIPTVDWEDIILPDALKTDIMNDVRSFYDKGVKVYQRLKLKPFRKLLFAGVPGTGKTMICSALAKWALAQRYVVIYVSSSLRMPGEPHGSTFSKIQDALDVACSSEYPVLVILEELDAYLHPDEKAMVLNVLDGNEATVNDYGTLMITTTNYPENIDERILKRPGRLDRIFIVPETKEAIDAERMLRLYMGDMWNDSFMSVVPRLVGYPGAFIREVAIYALTRMADQNMERLSLDMLEKSFIGLKDQIDARDDFLTRSSAPHRMISDRNFPSVRKSYAPAPTKEPINPSRKEG